MWRVCGVRELTCVRVCCPGRAPLEAPLGPDGRSGTCSLWKVKKTLKSIYQFMNRFTNAEILRKGYGRSIYEANLATTTPDENSLNSDLTYGHFTPAIF